MRFSQLFSKTSKSVSKETESINARLLTQAGFIYQEMAGVYAFLPLGWRVIQRIEAIVREEMDKISTELLLPSLSPAERWRATDRHDHIDVLMGTHAANPTAEASHNASYILNPTHEDIATPLAKLYRTSYKDFPFSFYQIQSKFRNEARAKSGLLRGREFIMKDLYSFHVSEESLREFYEVAKASYVKIYDRLGLGEDTFLTLASGGDFTDDYSHEFQTLLDSGEDTIYIDRVGKIAYNKEVTTEMDAQRLGVDFGSLEQVSATEVGNIFPLGTKFSKLLDYHFTGEDNQRGLVWMGSYGIGISRLMGVITEKFADDRGLVWPAAVAPADVHLVVLGDKAATREAADRLYDELSKADRRIEVLYDDRDVPAGVKFTDADLIGIPLRLTVSDKTLENDSAELKGRTATEVDMVPLGQIVERLSNERI